MLIKSLLIFTSISIFDFSFLLGISAPEACPNGYCYLFFWVPNPSLAAPFPNFNFIALEIDTDSTYNRFTSSQFFLAWCRHARFRWYLAFCWVFHLPLAHCRWVLKFWIYLSFVRLLQNRDLPDLTRKFFNKRRLISGSLCGTFNFTWKKIICYHSSPMDSHRNSLFVLFSSKNELVFAL